MQQLRQVRILILPGLAEFFLADGVYSIIEVTFNVEVVENNQGILCVLLDRGQIASGPVTGCRLDFS